jgi:DNA-binding response OmpR family regulator
MRIAILDCSPLTAWTIVRLLPPNVDYDVLPSFEEAHRVLCEAPPDAVLIGLTAGRLPWEDLLELCRSNRPEIPYLLYYSLNALPPGEPVPQAVANAAVSPVEIAELRLAVRGLLDRARSQDRTARSPG